jgi:HAD superfamily hydrolase (TIGR01509 family)
MKAFIFDMDGVMFDTERVHIRAWDYAAEKLGWDVPGIDMVKATLGMNIQSAEVVWREAVGEKYDGGLLEKYSAEYMQNFRNNNKVPVKEGLYPLLGYLKQNGYKLAVASSTRRPSVMKNLQSARLEDSFDAVVTGDMLEKSKPEPDIYLKACALLGCEPCEAYAVEDSRNGLLSALAAGCKTIMVPDLWEGEDELDRRLFAKCKTLDEIIELI